MSVPDSRWYLVLPNVSFLLHSTENKPSPSLNEKLSLCIHGKKKNTKVQSTNQDNKGQTLGEGDYPDMTLIQKLNHHCTSVGNESLATT